MSPDNCRSHEITIREKYNIPEQYEVYGDKVLIPCHEYRALKIIAKHEEDEYEKSLFNIIDEFYDKIQTMLVIIGALIAIPSFMILFIHYAKDHVFDFTLFLMAFITGILGLVGVMMPSNSKTLMTVVKSSRRKKCE